MVASVRQETASAWTAAASTTVTTPAFGSACLSGSLIEVYVIWGSNTNPSSVADSASQTYSIGASVADNNDGLTLAIFVFSNNASTTALTVTSTWATAPGFQGIWAKELTGVSSAPYQTSVGLNQVSPGGGTDAITSGNLTPTAQPFLLSSLSFEDGGNLASSAGTGFTLGTTGWSLAGSGNANSTTSESKRVTGSLSALAATYTNATDGPTRRMLTIAASYTELNAPAIVPTVGSITSSTSAPTVTPATATVITPFVARKHERIIAMERQLLVPDRKIFLPSRRVA